MNIDSFVVPSAGAEGQTMALSAQASSTVGGASLNYQWNFGDGSATQSGVNLTNVTHSYAAPATPGTPYTVTLTVNDGTGPATATASISISDVPPTANAGASQTIRAGSTATFNGSVSDPGGPSDIASIQWDFNYNGSTFNADPSANGNLTPSHAYTTPGTYLVALQATDQGGNVSQAFTTVVVKPTDALIVNAGPNLTVTAGNPLTLNGSYSDPGGTVSSSGIAWDTNYNGSTFNPVITGTLTPTTTFSTPGTYQVALRITDSTGASDLSVLNVTVSPVSHVGPTANAGPDQTISEGGTASFNGSYTDPDGTVSLSNVAWDFHYNGLLFNPQTTGTLTPTHQFLTPGTYVVALRVTDSNGLSSLSTLNLTVSAVTPTVSAGSNMTVTAGQLVSFSGTASDPGGSADPLSYAWDFNYNGTTFNPGSANTLTPYHVFTAAGTYVVALQATDSVGVSGLSTIVITVTPSNSLVVNAGPDQALNEGDTASFLGSWTDASGTVSTSTAQWDFNYDGQNFIANPSANGTLTPAFQFTSPGVYLVALQLTDSNNVTSIGTLYVSVGDVAPAVDAGPDQTVNQGATVSFAGTASKPSGAVDALTYAWDFNYDGQNFVADPSANGTLTPTHVFSAPGTYEVALQVTDAEGVVSLATMTVTVNDVAPTATVTNSGPTPEGSAVTFTVANLQDLTPGDTPTFLVDWTGSGQFQQLTSDDLTTHSDGSISFTHVYDEASGTPGYSAVVRILDGNGGFTNYTTNVVVTEVAPTAHFGPNSSGTIDATTPIVFSDVYDPSLADTLAGFTYFVSLDGGAYTSSNSPYYYLPSGITLGSHNLTGYVQDSEGQTSPIYTSNTANVVAPQSFVTNSGNGQIQLNWTGAPAPVVVDANTSYFFSGTAPGLTITLLTSGATANLLVNTNIATVNAAAGVTNVNLSVSTFVTDDLVGNGDIGEIDLPTGSTLSVDSRGNLGSIVGPSSTGTLTGTTATDLAFVNLTGSIAGLDSIGSLTASGWLGTSASQQVAVAAGISSLTAYGVGATVYADERQDAGDPVMQVTVGDGGVPGVINAGNVSGVQIVGIVNVFNINTLEGTFDPSDVTGTLTVENTKDGPNGTDKLLRLGNVSGKIVFDGNSPEKITAIRATGRINQIVVNNNLTLTGTIVGGVPAGNGNIVATSIGSITGSGSLTGNNIRATQGIGKIDLKGDLSLTTGTNMAGEIAAKTGPIISIKVGGNLTALVQDGLGNVFGTRIDVMGNFTGNVDGGKGSTGPIDVGGNFTLPGNTTTLVKADGNIDDINVLGNIGGTQTGQVAGNIAGGDIETIQSLSGSILLSSISTTNKVTGPHSINAISAPAGYIKASVMAIGGDIDYVEGYAVQGNLTAKVLAPNFTATSGGNIVYVYSTTTIPANVTLTADWYVGKIKVKNMAGDTETFKVNAQGGGTFTPSGRLTGQNTLLIDVGPGNYLGTVSLGATQALKRNTAVAKFANNDTLLTVKAQGNSTNWIVTGPATESSTKKESLCY